MTTVLQTAPVFPNFQETGTSDVEERESSQRDPRKEGTAEKRGKRRSQKNGNTFLYLKPTRLCLLHQTANTAQLTDVPGEGTGCQDLPRPSNPALDRKVRTHLAGAPFPGTAGAPRTAARSPRAVRQPISRSAPGQQSRAGPPRVHIPAARSPAVRALMRAPRPPRAPPARRALLYRALAHARCTSLPRAHQPGLGPRNAQSARPEHLKRQAPAPELPVVASRRASRSPCDV